MRRHLEDRERFCGDEEEARRRQLRCNMLADVETDISCVEVAL